MPLEAKLLSLAHADTFSSFLANLGWCFPQQSNGSFSYQNSTNNLAKDKRVPRYLLQKYQIGKQSGKKQRLHIIMFIIFSLIFSVSSRKTKLPEQEAGGPDHLLGRCGKVPRKHSWFPILWIKTKVENLETLKILNLRNTRLCLLLKLCFRLWWGGMITTKATF